jgi:organic hydroperoxide reductase OsmC/OhrA
VSGKSHRYQVALEWSDPSGVGTTRSSTHSRNHVMRIAGKGDLAMSSDASFRGDPSLHNPEDLLVASLASCHMLWYLGLCAKAGIAVVHYADEAVGVMIEDAAHGGHFERVTLRPRVTLAGGSDIGRARDLHREAHRLCFVANSVNFPVECEPTVVHA